jgi:hypothetical protein
MESDQNCMKCASSALGGELSFRKETRKSGGEWMSRRTLASHALCPSCLAWVGQLMKVASQPGALPESVLGFPLGGDVGLADERHCSYCHSEFHEEAYGVDLVPDEREFVRTSLFRHVGDIRQQRICRQCHAWWITILRDSSSLTGESFRRAEGGVGGWLTTVPADAAGLFLRERDAYILQSTVEGMGRRYYPMTIQHVRALDTWDETPVVFISAGKRDRAALVVGQCGPAVRARMVITARSDCMGDALEAMRAGAADIMASPLSPQQVSGAFDRVYDPAIPQERHAATGLRIFRKEHFGPRYGLPCFPLSLAIKPSEDVPALTLLLRRFVRGYDRLGVDSEGRLLALLYVAPEHAAAVVNRMTKVLGDQVQLIPAVPIAGILHRAA